jgi:hypothetical protein
LFRQARSWSASRPCLSHAALGSSLNNISHLPEYKMRMAVWHCLEWPRRSKRYDARAIAKSLLARLEDRMIIGRPSGRPTRARVPPSATGGRQC